MAFQPQVRLRPLTSILTASLLAIPLVTSCGSMLSGESADGKKFGGTDEAFDPVGTWDQECMELSSARRTDILGMTESMEFTDSTLTKTVVYFADAACSDDQKYLTETTTRTYTAGDASSVVSGATNVDLGTVTQHLFALHQTADVTLYNASSAYGKTTWAVDTNIDVTGLDTDGAPADEEGTVYTVLKTTADHLYAGLSEEGGADGSTEAKRHASISLVFSYSKVAR
jgi:hypothetical protein